MRRGAVTLMMVLMVSMFAMVILAVGQSRLLLAVQRNQSVSDILAATYAAESEIYDWIARFVGGYSGLNAATVDTQKNLADGTVLKVKGSGSGTTETLDIMASRPFASTNFRLTRTDASTSGGGFDSLEIALSLDCTSSMNEPATTECRSLCCTDPKCDVARENDEKGSDAYRSCMTVNSCTTRISELKKASLVFLDELQSFANEHGDKEVLVGINVFKTQAAWRQFPTASIPAVRNYVQSNFGKWYKDDFGQGSLACKDISGSTSIGGGFDISHARLRTTKQADRKQVVVLVTDGEPNARTNSFTDPGVCGNIYCSMPDDCFNPDTHPGANPLDYLRCSLKTVPNGGIRDPDVDAYAVSVTQTSSADEIFSDPQLIQAYFRSADATQLDDLLKNIFDEIVSSLEIFKIERVVPEL